MIYAHDGLAALLDEYGVLYDRAPDGAVAIIYLHGTEKTDSLLLQIGDAPCVEALEMSSCDASDVGLEALARLPNLQKLMLDSTRITGNGLRHLQGLHKLIELDVGPTVGTDAGMEVVSQLSTLNAFGCSSSDITDAGLARLASLHSLHELDLSNTKVSGQAFGKLAHLPLRYITLEDSQLNDEGAKMLSHITTLETLFASWTQITHEGVAHLAHLSNLQLLAIGGPRITDAALPAITALSRLTDLYLKDAAISDEGLQHLHAVKSLKYLNLMECDVTQAAVKQLHQLLPACEIDR